MVDRVWEYNLFKNTPMFAYILLNEDTVNSSPFIDVVYVN